VGARKRLRAWWVDRPIRTKGLVVVALPLIALFLIIPLLIYSNEQARGRENWVAHTLEVRTRIEGVRSPVFEATSRLRGYLLTGSPVFLGPYQAAAGEVPGAISSLGGLVSDNPIQVRRVARLRSVSGPLMVELAELAQSKPTSRLSATELADILESKAQVDQVSGLLDAMRAEEDRLLVERRASARAANTRTTVVAIAALTAGLLGGIVAALLFAAGVVRRIGRLQENARLLAEGRPLLPRPKGDDELGQLGAALDAASNLLRERERALTESEEQLRAVIDHSNSVIFMKDREGHFLVLNRTFEELFHINRETALGRTVHDLFPSEAADPWRENDRAVLEGRVPVQFEETAPGDDGEHVFLSTKVPVLDETGEPFGLVGISTDITERKRNEEALESARAQADRANRAKSEFLSRMSHELRTPLNAILGFGQLLEMDGLEEEHAESVRQILKGGRHLLDLINEVLDIARIESGRMKLSLEPVILADALQETVDLIRPLAREQRIELRTEDPCPADTLVKADRQRLKQVMLNLLSNAVKYNREGGTVTVRCLDVAGGRWRVEVGDDGPGIRPELLERLFVPFERLGAETSAVQGTGLGLALSKGLMEAMDGTLGVKSTPGQGSTFFVELPRAQAPGTTGESEAVAGPAVGAPMGSHTILYIEDNLANLSLIEAVLNRRPGLNLLTAMQGSLGVDLARQHRPDLILLDLHLPDISGREVLQRLQGDPRTRGIPVIVISADATPGQIGDLLAAGAVAYLTKPIDVSRFFHAMDEALAERRLDDVV
jgi:PAS domain S-box-containing protein